jgi:hypothetical protein
LPVPAARVGAVAVSADGSVALVAAGAAVYVFDGLAAPIGRVVDATVLGSRAHRTLDVRIRVSEAARAAVRLTLDGAPLVTRTFDVKGGGNELKAPLRPGAGHGAARVSIAVADTNDRERDYGGTVFVPR